MEHKIPSIREVTLELSDFNFFHGGEINPDNIHFRLNISPSFEAPNFLVFFIHIRSVYKFEDNAKDANEFSIFHTDYLCKSEVKERNWESGGTIEVQKTFLAHILGMCFLMIRGAISIRLKSHPLYNLPLPIINPLKLLEESLKQDADMFILEYEKIGFIDK